MFYELELVIFPQGCSVQALGFYIMCPVLGPLFLLRTKFTKHLPCAKNGFMSYSMRIPSFTITEIDSVITPILQKE